MSCLGVLFSLEEKEVEKLKEFTSDEARLEYIQEDIETIYFEKYPQRVAELDKAWDALHRCLTDGKLEYRNGQFPLNHIILGGEILYTSGDYIMTLKTPEQVKKIAEEIVNVNIEYLLEHYQKIDPDNYGFPLTEKDFEYTWAWFEESKVFWQLAAAENRHVLFTADQ